MAPEKYRVLAHREAPVTDDGDAELFAGIAFETGHARNVITAAHTVVIDQFSLLQRDPGELGFVDRH